MNDDPTPEEALAMALAVLVVVLQGLLLAIVLDQFWACIAWVMGLAVLAEVCDEP